MKRILIFFLFVIQGYFLSAQTISINTVEVCAAQEVFLPVNTTSLLNVGALTLYIGFDTNLLSFDSVVNVDPQLSGMSMNLMTNPIQIAFAWSSTTAVNFANGKLFDLKFHSVGISAPVSYNPGCEIADPSGTVIPVAFINGAINSGLPFIETQPENSTVTEGETAWFTVSSPNALSYFWKESPDDGASWFTLEDEGIYSGTHSPELTINQVPLTIDNNRYQCVLIRENCQALSEEVTLSVDALTSAVPVRSPDLRNLQVTPNPFANHARISFTLSDNTDVNIQVLNFLGQPVFDLELSSPGKGDHHISVATCNWQTGIYFLKMTQKLANHNQYQIVKIIKNS